MRRLLALCFLLSLSSAYSSDQVPAVFFSHLYVVLDQPSYDALRASPEVAALGNAEEKHTTAGPRNWTGFYMYGRQTYMEFFGANASPASGSVPDSGLGLTVEESGGVAAIAAHLRTAFGERVEVDTTPATTATGTIPWFTSTGVNNKDRKGLSIWFMEIDPGFLAAKHPGATIAHPLSREQYNSWNFRPDRPLEDVVGLTAALNPSDMTQLATELELIGWSVQRGGRGFVALGPDMRLTIVLAGSREGIQRVELRLQHSVPKQTIALGNAELVLEGKAGHFIFGH